MKRACVLSLALMALLYWGWPSEAPIAPASPALVTAPSTHTPQSRPWARTPVRAIVSEDEAVAMQRTLPLEWIRVQLNSDPALQQQIAVFNSFDPRSFLPPLAPQDLPDSPTTDALEDLLSQDRRGDHDVYEAFLDAVDQDPELEGFDTDWIDIIDLETERLLAEEDYEDAEAEVMALLEQANHLPEKEALELTMNLPRAGRENGTLIGLAEEIVDEDPLHEIADVARLYAARGLADYASIWPDETRATELLLDTLANSESPEVQQQAIRMLVEMMPGRLHPGDVELLENTWYTLDDNSQSQLSRFLTAQHFAEGDLAGAEVWADRFEAEILTGEMNLSTHDDFLREIDHTRARIGARRGTSARSWRVGVEQASWACWEGPDGKAVTSRDDHLDIVGWWEDGWTFTSEQPHHPLAECLLTRLEDIADPAGPVRVRLSIRILGIPD